MENVIYNDLVHRGFDVDVGVVEIAMKDENRKKVRKQLEVNFVVNKRYDRYTIRSALNIADPEKKNQEIQSLLRIPDSFKKLSLSGIICSPCRMKTGSSMSVWNSFC